MIAVTLHFDEENLPRFSGNEAGQFFLDMLKSCPKFAVDAADKIDVRGAFGKLTETRE